MPYSGRRNSRPSSRGRGGRFSKRKKFQKQRINHDKYIQKADPQPLIEEESGVNFADTQLHEFLKRNILKKGFQQATPIQAKVMSAVQEGRDVLGIAATGTGKTAAFLIPLIDKILQGPNGQQILVIAPTRELALQIEQELKSLEQRSLKIFSISLVGGTSVRRDVKNLKRKSHFYIGTPGRILDHLEKGHLNISNASTCVLDEADQMLDMGFAQDIKDIQGYLPDEFQSLLFTATLNKKMRPFADAIVDNPVVVEIKQQDASKNVHQDVIKFNTHHEKVDKLHELLEEENTSKTLVFTETKAQADRLSDELYDRGLSVEAIHGDKSLKQRRRALENFKKGRADVLVATDVAARGIDIKNVSHVVNYDEPNNYDTYIHRIGRTGRAGNVGWAYTFVKSAGGHRVGNRHH